MEWTDTVKLNGKDYKFEHVEDEPLTLIMKIDDVHHLQRDIDCDMPLERIRLIKKYKSVTLGVEADATLVEQIYHGKDIRSEEFMKALLENSLHGIIDEIKYEGRQNIL